jgi:hypothetical protein
VRLSWQRAATSLLSSSIPRSPSFTRLSHITSAAAPSALALTQSPPILGSSLGTVTCTAAAPPPSATAAVVGVVRLTAAASGAEEDGVAASMEQYEVREMCWRAQGMLGGVGWGR